MPKNHTFPALYDECRTISITDLRKWGYLSERSFRSGVVYWSRHGTRYASIGILVNTWPDGLYIEFNYKCNDVPINYRVKLVKIPSNLGKGEIYLFQCPNTGKRCKKLYAIDRYYLHRDAFRGAMYEVQTYSKNARQQIKSWRALFAPDKIYEEIYSKHFRKQYAGRPTKRYLKLWKKLRAAGEITESDLLNFL